MIDSIWDKKIISLIQIDQNDIGDDFEPLPLFLQLSWNHYIGLYYDQIQAFYSSYLPYPIVKDQFYMTLDEENIQLNGTEIIGHLVTLYEEGIKKPLKLTCHFRNKISLPCIQLKKYFKNSLKASTCIRNGRFGASILTVQMSIQNVQNMFESFFNNDIKKFKGSDDFNSDNLGYSFVISKTQRIPIKIISKQFLIERGVPKDKTLGQFLAQLFGQFCLEQKQPILSISQRVTDSSLDSLKPYQELPDKTLPSQQQSLNQQAKKQSANKQLLKNTKHNYIFQKYSIYLQGIKLQRGQYTLSFFQRFCHPDGYLYLLFIQNV